MTWHGMKHDERPAARMHVAHWRIVSNVEHVMMMARYSMRTVLRTVNVRSVVARGHKYSDTRLRDALIISDNKLHLGPGWNSSDFTLGGEIHFTISPPPYYVYLHTLYMNVVQVAASCRFPCGPDVYPDACTCMADWPCMTACTSIVLGQSLIDLRFPLSCKWKFSAARSINPWLNWSTWSFEFSVFETTNVLIHLFEIFNW